MKEYVGFISNMNEVCIDEKQPIVRCRDCRMRSDIVTRWSDNPLHECLAEWCKGAEGDHPLVDLDGFCAWGETKGRGYIYESNGEPLANGEGVIFLARAERTCKQEERGWSTEGDHARVWLTCGHDCMVPTVADLPRYCPNCGAKVVDA